MIAFEQHAQVKDNYCVGYFGPELSHVQEIIQARPILESAFPGVQIFISCRDEHAAVLSKHDRIVPVSHLKARRRDFAYVRDLKHNGKMTPAKILLHESGISMGKIST